jgi:hypothetical protein
VRSAAGDPAGRQFAALLDGGGLALGETGAGRIATLRPTAAERIALAADGPVTASGPLLLWAGRTTALPARPTALAAGTGWAAAAVPDGIVIVRPDAAPATLPAPGAAARLAASPDGGMLAAAHGRRLRIWDLPDGAVHADLELDGVVTAVAFGRDPGIVAAGLAEGEVVLVDIDLGLPVLRLAVGEGAVDGVAWGGDGRILAARPAVGPLVVWSD